MSDFDTDTSIPVPPPSEPALSSAPESEIINERRNLALGQLAKSEDISSYVAEREDQAAAIDRGEDLPQERANQWYRRAHKALTDAANEAAGIQTNGQDEQSSEPPPGYIAGDEAMHEIETARKTGAAALRVQQYFGDNSERKQKIIDWHQSLDPQGVVAGWVIDSETAAGPQIMEQLADNPEALQQIAEMPPHQRDRWLGMLEGKIVAEAQLAQRLQQQWPQERRVTQAPPPIRPPRGGGALPPSDIHQLASRSESVDDYVKARKAMEKHPRD